MPAADQRHAGARRAALPVAEGHHGRALQGDRRRCRWPTSGSTRRASAGRGARAGRRPAEPPEARAATLVRETRPTRPARSSTSWPRGGSSDGGTIWVHRRAAVDGSPTKLSTELATLARELAEAGGGAVSGLVIEAHPAAAATELAAYLPRVLAVTEVANARTTSRRSSSASGWPRSIARAHAGLRPRSAPAPTAATSPASLSALTDLAVLANATAVRWADGGRASR